MPVTKAPPNPSTVNAPATRSGSPVDLGVAEIGKVHLGAGRRAHRAGGAAVLGMALVDQPVAGMQDPGSPTHLPPAFGRLLR